MNYLSVIFLILIKTSENQHIGFSSYGLLKVRCNRRQIMKKLGRHSAVSFRPPAEEMALKLAPAAILYSKETGS
jgi:hypothetical protein